MQPPELVGATPGVALDPGKGINSVDKKAAFRIISN